MPWVTDVYITDVDGGELGDYELDRELIFEDEKGRLWVTPAGFRGDLSSFPWFVRMLLPMTSLAKAPWPHDYGYREQPTKEEYLKLLTETLGETPIVLSPFYDLPSGKITRKTWDKIYLQGAIAEGMSKSIAKILYRGLRIGGGISWGLNSLKKQNKDVES